MVKCNICTNTFEEEDIIRVCGSERCPFCDCQTGLERVEKSG
jgi:hypothetical protein